jgi:hypothetical protein
VGFEDFDFKGVEDFGFVEGFIVFIWFKKFLANMIPKGTVRLATLLIELPPLEEAFLDPQEDPPDLEFFEDEQEDPPDLEFFDLPP